MLPLLHAAGVRTVVVRANHPDTDAPAPFYAGWDEVFDARPDADDSPLAAFLRALPTLLDRLAAGPDFLLWVETDRLVPPWDVRQDVFEAYLEDPDEDEPREDDGAEDEVEEGDAEDVAENEEVAEDGVEGVEEVDEVEEPEEDAEEVEDEEEPTDVEPVDEPVTPFSDPPTGPFDRADPDAWDWLQRSFAAVVTSLDAELGTAFDALRERGLDASAAWVVMSDYGYPLGEHGQIGFHRPWLHEELVHLPLVVRPPGGAEAGRHVPALTQPADLTPTLLALFGLPPPDGGDSCSLLPLARGEVESVRDFACSGLDLGDAAEWAIRTADTALLVPGRQPEGESREPMLFEKPDDRWEVNDLRSRNVERADELEAVLRKFVSGFGSVTSPLGGEVAERSEAGEGRPGG